jgi:hypothetical protein
VAGVLRVGVACKLNALRYFCGGGVRPLSEPGIKRATIVIVAAILGAEVFTELLRQKQADLFWDWLYTLMATVLAALFAVGVFEYQSRQTELDRQKKLLAALAAELQSNLDLIQSEPRSAFLARVLPAETSTMRYVQYAAAKLAPMQSAAADAAIRSGVFDAEDVYLLTRIVGQLYAHNNDVSYLTSVRASPVPVYADAIKAATQELTKRQEIIKKWCEELIEHLRKQERIVVQIPSESKETAPPASADSLGG